MATKTILILGAGYTGKELIRLVADTDYNIVATSRNDETTAFIKRHGGIAIDWNVDDSTIPWAEHLGPSTTVVYSIPTLYRHYESNDDPPRHVAPVARAVETCRDQGADRFIYLSSTSVYGDHGGEWVDETTPRDPTSPYGEMRRDIEDYLEAFDADFPINIARLVGIYGPGRTLIDLIDSGRYTLVDGGRSVTNRVHVHDIARALIAIIERGPDGFRVFNVTDGRPQPSRSVVEFICENTDVDMPPEETLDEYAARRDNPNAVARRKNTIRVLNDRLRNELDFKPVYPDVFAGYQQILYGSESN